MSCRDTTPDPNNLFATQLKVESMADQMDKMQNLQKELGTISDKMQKELGTISKNLKARDEKENKREQVDKENKEALKIALLKAPLAVHRMSEALENMSKDAKITALEAENAILRAFETALP